MTVKESIEQVPTLIESVKTMLSKLKEKFEEPVVQKFMDAKLADGTVVSWDGEMPTSGLPFFIVDEAKGERLPAPDGEYQLEDGSIIVIVNAIIAEIKPSEAPKEEEVMAEAPAGQVAPQAAPQATTPDVKSIVESIIKETRFINEEYEAKFASIEKENVDLKASVESLTGLLKETFEVIEKIASQPSAAPKEKKDGFMVRSIDEKEQAIKDFKKKYDLTN